MRKNKLHESISTTFFNMGQTFWEQFKALLPQGNGASQEMKAPEEVKASTEPRVAHHTKTSKASKKVNFFYLALITLLSVIATAQGQIIENEAPNLLNQNDRTEKDEIDTINLRPPLTGLFGGIIGSYDDGDGIPWNTINLKRPLPSTGLFTGSTEAESESRMLGVTADKVELPSLFRGAKVLDVGAGRGVIAARIRDELGCDVYALEPSFVRSTDYDECVAQLGSEHVDKMTLQEALENNPEKYTQAFDAVVVFKYNVSYLDKETFIKGLTQVIKPDGIVYITSVERGRFELQKYAEGLYLTDTLRKYFSNVSFIERRKLHGADLLATCRAPRLELSMDSPSTPLRL